MKFFSFRRPVFAIAGALAVVASVWASYWWFYKFGPLRKVADPAWISTHSESARWDEEQKMYRRLDESPDLYWRGDRIGYYGGKEWFLWLSARLEEPGFHCECIQTALALMSNQHAASWSEWLEVNRAHSQEEWIRDGFAAYGAQVSLPPEESDTVPLLKLLGRKPWNTLNNGPQNGQEPESVPTYVHYNAYRWLRDSGFAPIRFANANQQLALEPGIAMGLLRFSKLDRQFPKDELGSLSFGAKDSDSGARSRISPPRLVETRMKVGVPAGILVGAIGGMALLFLAGKKARPSGSGESADARVP